ncbi:DUF2750 domain-containing protein [Gallibacterium genomosp. 3]|uniref:DUF2750 domain-containing protein n=1 Tax=Gallibacterium genomosp. 3 TaxID=505345 RepID=UPI0008026C55|nr:DUF2750 domain-containing protein [Gallibacterium genomosp. 3]
MTNRKKEINSILSLKIEEIYLLSIKRISEYEEVWVLDDDGILTYGNEEQIYFPIWPEKIFAELNATNEWKEAKPYSISLEEFLLDFIPNLIENNYFLSIFPRENAENFIVHPKDFARDIDEYACEYFGESYELTYL